MSENETKETAIEVAETQSETTEEVKVEAAPEAVETEPAEEVKAEASTEEVKADAPAEETKADEVKAEEPVAETPAEPEEPEEISYHAVEKEGEITAIWEMQGRKHIRTISARSDEGVKILSLFTSEIHETDSPAMSGGATIA